MRRAYLALVLALATVLGTIPSNAGPSSQGWQNWARRAWTPRDLGGVLVESWADSGVTLHTTPRAAGTTPPAVTWSGVLTPAQELCLAIDSTAGGTARGQATFRWSQDGCATYIATGVLTAASTDLATVQGTVAVAWPAGTYNTDQTWKAIVSSVLDKNGSNAATQATAANMPLYRATLFNGRPALDWGVGTTFSLTTPSIALGAHTFLMAVKGDASSGYAISHNTGSTRYVYGTITCSSFASVGGVSTCKNVSSSWLRDSARKTLAVSYGGAHASHLIYVNGVDVSASTGIFSGDPGVGFTTNPIYIGSAAAGSDSFRGLICGWTVVNRVLTPREIQLWHSYAVGHCPL